MDKRYQVFVSSTFTDLKEERKAIIQNLLEAKYIPAGMEMFSASNDEQFSYIKKILDTCDYYVLVISGRYGTVNSTTGLSYTEQEYDYAVQQGIPVLAFLHEYPDSLPPERKENINTDKFNEFRNKVKEGRLCKMWATIDGLVAGIIISLTKEISNYPRPGWNRGGEYDNSELLTQLNHLRLEKEDLERKVLALQEQIDQAKPEIQNLARCDEYYIVKGTRYHYEDLVKASAKLTWDMIFSAVGPYLVTPVDFDTFTSNLLEGINSAYDCDIAYINEDSVQTIKLQLEALKLINVSTSQTETNGLQETIQLSSKGKSYLMQIKTIKNNDE